MFFKKKNTPKRKEPTLKIEPDNPFYDLIQEAYQVFTQVPTDHGVCDCCMSSKIRKDFFNHGQAELPLSYLQEWFYAAADLDLDKAKWRFVLPRILEAIACKKDPTVNFGSEGCLKRYPTGNANNWSIEEWSVLDRFQRLLFTQTDLISQYTLDAFICMFAVAGWDVDDLFSQVIEWPTDKLVDQLWHDWIKRDYFDISFDWKNQTIPIEFYTSEKMINKISDFASADTTSLEMSKKANELIDLLLSI